MAMVVEADNAPFFYLIFDLISNSQSSSWSIAWMRQWGVNNLPKVVAQQHHGRGSNLRPLDRKSDTLPFSHRATPVDQLVNSCDYQLQK